MFSNSSRSRGSVPTVVCSPSNIPHLPFLSPLRYAPEMAANLTDKLKMGVHPAGSNCLMKFMPREARPFMGPNLYLTPPGSVTAFHQDGHGTVDSGHQCLQGRNDVVMLRRMDEQHKLNALKILAGDAQGDGRGACAWFAFPSDYCAIFFLVRCFFFATCSYLAPGCQRIHERYSFFENFMNTNFNTLLFFRFSRGFRHQKSSGLKWAKIRKYPIVSPMLLNP